MTNDELIGVLVDWPRVLVIRQQARDGETFVHLRLARHPWRLSIAVGVPARAGRRED